MARTLTTYLHHLRQAALHREGGPTDGELLDGFIHHHDAAAFETLLRRHGPMVLGVCRRLLRNEADAEDAFQATFLVLVRKASSIRPRSKVGHWLHGVAHNTALKAKALAVRRRTREAQAAISREQGAVAGDSLRTLLDEELQKLPEKYRSPLLLCDLEERTIQEAARQLGCPQGTLASRLARGRQMLARRLARHGLPLLGGTLTASLLSGSATAAVPPALARLTLRAAVLLAAGQTFTTDVIPASVLALMKGVLQTMRLMKLKIPVVVLLVLGLCAGTGWMYQRNQAVAQPAQDRAALQEGPRTASQTDRQKLQGIWTLVHVEHDGRKLDVPRGSIMLNITENSWVWTEKGKPINLRYQIDATKTPKTVDLTLIDERPDKGTVVPGIFQLTENVLILCESDDDKTRPTSLTAPKGSKNMLFVYTRPAPVPPTVDREIERVFGTDAKERQAMIKLHNKGLLLATDAVMFADDGRLKVFPCSLGLYQAGGKKAGSSQVQVLHAPEAFLVFDRPITQLGDVGQRRLIGIDLPGGTSLRFDRQKP